MKCNEVLEVVNWKDSIIYVGDGLIYDWYGGGEDKHLASYKWGEREVIDIDGGENENGTYIQITVD